jgi:hypothetical protein
MRERIFCDLVLNNATRSNILATVWRMLGGCLASFLFRLQTEHGPK